MGGFLNIDREVVLGMCVVRKCLRYNSCGSDYIQTEINQSLSIFPIVYLIFIYRFLYGCVLMSCPN